MDTTAGELLDHPRSGHPQFYRLLDEMAATHDRKNRDYANAADPFANFRACERAGVSMVDGIYTRMSDKWERVTNLLAKRRKGDGPAVTEEPLQDTLIDLANYCLIEAIALDEEEVDARLKRAFREEAARVARG